MGLRGDIEEIRSVWRSAPWRYRVVLVLSLVLASGSIASLSETVTKWKGFILDGVTFYRNYVSEPVNEFFLKVFGPHLPRGIGDASILLLLLVSANMRLALYRGAGARARGSAVAMSISPILLYAGLVAWKGRSLSVNNLAGALLAVGIYAHFVHWHAGGATRLLWLVYICTPFAIVGVIAAVNVGLSR